MSFHFLTPASVPEVLAALDRYGQEARLVAGATDLGVLLRRGRIRPTHMISLSGVEALRRLEVTDGEVVIGAGVCHRTIEHSPLFAGALAALPEACATVGSVQIRNVGTVGGNLCNASPAADTPPVLLAFDAAATIAGPGGTRRVPLTEFFLGYRQTALQPGELLLDVRFPQPGPRTGSAFEKLGRRKAMEISIACVGALVTLAEDGRTCAEVRIGLGSVAETSIRARQAEAVLRGRELTPESLRAAGQTAAAECRPIDDLRASAGYRRLVVEALVVRALERAGARARTLG